VGVGIHLCGFRNRTAQFLTKGSGPTVSLSINPANNRINSSGYTYDANGNLTAMPGSTFVYDIENRMVQVTSSGSEYYGYDPWNRRVWKTTTTDGAGKIFFYGAMGELMGTYSCGAGCSGTPPTVETNLHFAGKLIRWDNGAVVLDRLGGVVKRSNIFASPWINQTSNYYPFGEERTATGQDRTKFATYYRDNKTGFDYAMNRYYNSSWGRFTTADPSGGSASPANPLSWNRYAYVANDPVNYKDPHGLFPCTVGAGEGEEVTNYEIVEMPGILPRMTLQEWDDEHGSGRSSDAFIAQQSLRSFIAGLPGRTFSTECKDDLLAVGTSIGEVVGYLQDAMRNGKIGNGTNSYAMVSGSFMLFKRSHMRFSLSSSDIDRASSTFWLNRKFADAINFGWNTNLLMILVRRSSRTSCPLRIIWDSSSISNQC
jgi:RHS repeat-associated protein